MLRMILAVIVGFIVWSVVWIGTDAVFAAVSPEFAKHFNEFQAAVNKNEPYNPVTWVMIFLIVLSVFCSLISGFVTALIAKENFVSTLILGILLLAFGIFVEISYWKYFPLWYHIVFLLLLIPMTILGGKSRKTPQEI